MMLSEEVCVFEDTTSCLSENINAFSALLIEAEEYARRILVQQWFSEFSIIKSNAVAKSAGIFLLQKHAFGRGSNASSNKEISSGSDKNGGINSNNKERKKKGNEFNGNNDNNDDDDGVELAIDAESRRRKTVTMSARHSSVGRDMFKFQRRKSGFLCAERNEREKIEEEEIRHLLHLQLMMEEDLMRVLLKDEFAGRLQLIHDVMKPRICWRYSFAWGIVEAVAWPPSWREMERIRSSERHKPAYMRRERVTCKIPFLSTNGSCSNTIASRITWDHREFFSPPLGLLQLRSDM